MSAKKNHIPPSRRVDRAVGATSEPLNGQIANMFDNEIISLACLLHKWTDGKPKAVGDAELILQLFRIVDARIRVRPFVRRKTGQHPENHWNHDKACMYSYTKIILIDLNNEFVVLTFSSLPIKV